jgi:hypothetical protein
MRTQDTQPAASCLGGNGVRSLRGRSTERMMRVIYEKPVITDLGSIADHTFGGANPGGNTPRKDTRLCEKDNMGDESCPSP